MSILSHESLQDIKCDRAVLRAELELANKQLNRIHDAIPEWVHQKFPQYTLAERITAGFAFQEKQRTKPCKCEPCTCHKNTNKSLDSSCPPSSDSEKSTDDTYSRMVGLFCEQFGIGDENEIKPDTILTDLGMDSLDAVELVMSIEEEFGLELPDEEAEKVGVLPFSEIVKYIDGKLRKRKPSK